MKIQQAIDAEDYDRAKQLKEEIAHQKAEINAILEGDEGGEEDMGGEEEEEDNEFASVEKVEQAGNEFMEGGQSPSNSRVAMSHKGHGSRV